MTEIILAVCLAIAIGVVMVGVYWQLVVAEGAYLGRRVVALLYDWHAPCYDRVKQFQPASDAAMLAAPILEHLSAHGKRTAQGRIAAWMLDIATGTGRLPAALLAQPAFDGRIVALDISRRMLGYARAKLADHVKRIDWILDDAQRLPFQNASFDVVACLEALEFFPRPLEAVAEMVRVLKAGGLLLISNRVGPDVWKLPRRTMPSADFAARLRGMGLEEVVVERWLIDYDLLLAAKPLDPFEQRTIQQHPYTTESTRGNYDQST
ncbi:MAG: class I SAM-dependent methyltransferase [Anaerolineae bacterium]|nr:class I SAM-dependent methyltransferase [Thermoflexales bacterium]MDW8408553.1 class I SAM-dependent methyltransferase [Anaerolineae bacterium]